jgi:transcription elongation factor Elf1
MTVVIKSIEEHGQMRKVTHKCPDCGWTNWAYVKVGAPNTTAVICRNCEAKYTITWEESDEAMT